MELGRIKYILAAKHIRPDRLRREKLARGDLLQRRGMKDVIHSFHCIVYAQPVAHVANEIFDLRIFVKLPHIVLLLLVATEDPYLANISIEKASQNSIAKRTGTAGYQ
jgi:hypothetical protein